MPETETLPTETPVGDPPAPAEEPKPATTETPAETPVTEEPKPGEEKPPETEVPAQSAFDKLVEGVTDPDEIEAIRERLRDKLPEDRRIPKVDTAATEAQDAILADQRRREAVRGHEGQRDGAVARLNGHLREVKKTLLSADDPNAVEYDGDLLTNSINEIVQAEIALARTGEKELLATAISARLDKHGVHVTKEMIQAVAEGKAEHGVPGAALDALLESRYQAGLVEGQAQAKSKDEIWKKGEAIAVRAEVMREREGEPDAGVSRPAGSLTKERLRSMSPQEIMELPAEELDKALQAVS